jgi:hypothetical protein
LSNAHNSQKLIICGRFPRFKYLMICYEQHYIIMILED